MDKGFSESVLRKKENVMELNDFFSWCIEWDYEKYTISPKDVYEKAWECRNFELTHLWQRSIFLGAFLLAIAGAYGKIIFELYFSNSPELVDSIKICVHSQHFIAACVCWLGIVFSILWIMMAKGSKYWFEKYEALINCFEDGSYGEKIRNWYHHGNLPKLKKDKYNENIFSPKAGHYSVSKVNGTIGIFALCVFSFMEMFHFANFLHGKYEELNSLQYSMFSISLWLGLGSIIFMVLRYLCMSGEKDE